MTLIFTTTKIIGCIGILKLELGIVSRDNGSDKIILEDKRNI